MLTQTDVVLFHVCVEAAEARAPKGSESSADSLLLLKLTQRLLVQIPKLSASPDEHLTVQF